MHRRWSRTPRASQSHGPYAIVRDMQIFAQQIDHLQANFSMVVQEAQKVFAADRRHPQIIQSFRGHFIAASCQRGTEPQYLSGGGDTQSQAASVLGAQGEAHPPFAQQKNAARRLALAEQHGSPRADLGGLDPVKGFESIGRQVAEDTL